MSWTQIADSSGTIWMVNADGLTALLRSSVRARFALANSQVVSTGHWPNPIIQNVETNWGQVKAETELEVRRQFTTLWLELLRAPANAPVNLAAIAAGTRANQQALARMRQSAMEQSMNSVRAAIRFGETGEAVARFIRNLSATALVAIAAVPTGGGSVAAGGLITAGSFSTGTATTALAAGSALTGFGKWQDTGNVGAAMISGIGTFTVGAIGLGSVQGTGQQATLVAVQSLKSGQMAAMESLVEGDKVETILKKSLVATAGTALGGGINMRLANTALTIETRIAVDMAMSTASSAVSPSPETAAQPASPLVSGGVTASGVPQRPEGDADFIQKHVLRRL